MNQARKSIDEELDGPIEQEARKLSGFDVFERLDDSGLDGVVIDKPSRLRIEESLDQRGAKLIFLMHGFGDVAKNMLSLADYLRPLLHHKINVIAPNAMHQHFASHGRQWFSLPMQPEIWELPLMRFCLRRLTLSQMRRFGVTPKDVAVIGFSQGAMAALHHYLQEDEPVGLVVGASGLLLDQTNSISKNPPPVLLTHSRLDCVVPASCSIRAYDLLTKMGVLCQLHLEDDGGHSITPQTVRVIADALNKIWSR